MFGRKVAQSGPENTTPESALSRAIGDIVANSAGQHPLDVAAKLTALFSTQDCDDDRVEFIRIRDIDHPTVCDLSRMEGDPVGLSFSFYGTAGETGLIYLTTAFAQLAQQGAAPGPRVPAEMLSRIVRDYDEAVRKLVHQRSPQRAPDERDQEAAIKARLSRFLG